MASVNKVFLMGNLTRDPELRYTTNGSAVTDLGLAVNRIYSTKDGDRREETLFIDVTVWNRQAENCCQYLKKGRPVHVEGYLKMDSWDDRNTGEKRTKIKVEAERVQFLGDNRRDEPSDDGGGEFTPAREPRRSAAESRGGPGNGASRSYGPPSSPSGAGGPRRPAPAAEPEPDPDDDIPF